MKGLLYILVFISTTLLVIVLYNLLFKRKKQVKARLDNIHSMNPLFEDEEALRQPLVERLIKPVYQDFLKFIGNAAPKQIKQKYENIINNAGSANKVTFTSIMAIQIMCSLLCGGILFLISSKGGKTNILLVLFATVLGFMLPFSFFRTGADQRKKKIKRSLPDLLDLLYVSVEAGLSFDMALKKTADKMPGALSEEINKTLEEISRGRNRQDALRGLVSRTGVEDLSYFVTSIIQTEQLGSNIANMLRIQSNTMRQKRRQRAEEAAMKVPVKMLFPLVFFIFPSLFIVVLGPAIIGIVDTLSKSL
jgi:tight adherence protein C